MEQDTIKILNKAFMLSAILVVGVLVFFVGEMFLQQKSINLQNQNQISQRILLNASIQFSKGIVYTIFPNSPNKTNETFVPFEHIFR